MAFDGAVSRGRGDICKERGTGDAEPDFLAFHIAARLEWAGGLIDTDYWLRVFPTEETYLQALVIANLLLLPPDPV